MTSWGAATDQASPEFAQLVDELKRLGEQAAITQFDQLKSATQETAEKLQQMQQAMSEAALALRVQDDALTKAAAISRFAAIVRPLNALHPMAPIDSGQQCAFAPNDGGFWVGVISLRHHCARLQRLMYADTTEFPFPTSPINYLSIHK